MDTPDELITSLTAAELIDRSVSTLHYYVESKQLTPALKAPGPRGAFFFHRADIEALAAKLKAAA